ncbi:Septum site-determining protein MinC [Pelotomaculum schinkii]|uniref:Septum site-determining protein MinC n=1 Tax=Pelotomaculum schinkii TaxID=78350 RepID=A0A4Y7RG63_9FIRM|nr:Septum site-determining protein MinC [Pelotomaculum schinkii]
MAYLKGSAQGDILSGFGQGSQTDDNLVDENTILVQRTLRSGQSVRYSGNVVILGDVNPGAEVAATGNIIVMGALRGVVHAGANGDETAVVMAFRLNPTQLRIANHITRPPDNETVDMDLPEIARIKDGVVTIEAFQTGGERQGKAI